jgi:5-methylcytosine-specific restriction endonuclease McrA
VPAATFLIVTSGGRLTLPCRSCAAEHYLAVREETWGFNICYQRYPNRYPLEDYDESDPFFTKCRVLGDPDDATPDDGFSGPVAIYPRKKQYESWEVRAIWTVTRGHCHLCGRAWRLSERGRSGWHIDHVIPHIGGGPDVEKLPNFRVACAGCNLKKGRGYTEATIRIGIRNLIETIKMTTHPKARVSQLARKTQAPVYVAGPGGGVDVDEFEDDELGRDLDDDEFED